MFQVFNHNLVLLAEFSDRERAEAEAALYTYQTGNFASVEEGAAS